MLILAGFTALLLYGGMAAVAGRMSVGTYSVLVFLIQQLLWPLTRLGETTTNINEQWLLLSES